MKISLKKMHGSGNTFYVLWTEDFAHSLWHEMAIKLCSTSWDGGADGLLLISSSASADVKMTVINADGSYAKMCGNGLRIVAREVLESLDVLQASIETEEVTLHVKKTTPIFEQQDAFAVEIKPITFSLSDIPMTYGNNDTLINSIIPEIHDSIHFSVLAVPNPHLVGLVPIQYIESRVFQEKIGTQLNESRSLFPEGVNLSFMHPVDEMTIFVRTFERGVGFTNACGTAMSASALVAYQSKLVESTKVRVINPGGFVECHLSEDQQSVFLIGNASLIETLEVTIGSDETISILSKTIAHDEMDDYERWKDYAENMVKQKWRK
ncbi:diaminopimelate epimerase [Paenisporosarcina cavernae]|nr:diaminopimelate epimerase [Paenisporosarcina cavernae]